MTTAAVDRPRVAPSRVTVVLLVTGILGFRVGYVQFPDWQVAIETAQVVARLVRYPSPTPFSLYHAELWTILHQLLALLLRIGFTEIVLSKLLSGVLGMLSLQALAAIVYAVSGDALVSIGATGLLMVTRATDFGVLYPIFLMGSSHTYGIVGLSYFVLVAGLLGAGRYPAAGFLLGLAPAVHPSIGVWLLLIVGTAIAIDWRARLTELRPALKPFLIGLGVASLSLAVQLATRDAVPSIDRAQAATYLQAFIGFWDGHRQPIPIDSDGVKLNALALLVCGIWLVAFARDLSRAATLPLRVIMVSSILSLIIVVVSWAPVDRIPQTLLIAMPSRVLNVAAYVFIPLLFGLVARYRRSTWGSLLLLAFTAGLLAVNRGDLWPRLEERGIVAAAWSYGALPLVQTMTLLLFVLVLRASNRRRLAADHSSVALIATPLPLVRQTARVLTLLMLGVLVVAIWSRPGPRTSTRFEDRTNDVALGLAAQGHGLLLSAGDMHLVQLRTRRPVLLDGGGLDGLPYSIAAAPQMVDILRDVYGVDFFHPPEEARKGGAVPPRYSRMVWESRTVDGWRSIASRYSVNDVLAPSDWTLDLPVVAQSREFRLYRIPG